MVFEPGSVMCYNALYNFGSLSDRGAGMYYIAIIIGLTFAYINGMHDGGTIVATAISSRLMAPRKAIIMAGIANFIGSVILGTMVVDTIYRNIVDLDPIVKGAQFSGYLFVIVAFAGSILWNLFTWKIKLPSSASHSLIGSMIGAGIAYAGISSIHWSSVFFRVVLAMIISPLIGFVFGYLFYKAEIGSLKYGTTKLDKRIQAIEVADSFLLSLSYGSNDSQKVMGLILIAASVNEGHALDVPLWLILACGACLALGTASGGYNMIRTVGFDITRMDSKKSFASQFAAFFVTTAANLTGLPISATQVVTATVAGVGTGVSVRKVNWEILGRILISWVVTIPCSGLVGYALFRFALLII